MRFDQTTIHTLVRPIPNRFRLCLEEKGQTIDHLSCLNQRPGEVNPVPGGILTLNLTKPDHVGEIVHLPGAVTKIGWITS